MNSLSICGKLLRNARAIYSAMRCYSSRYKPMELVSLDLESDSPRFIEDPTFNVIPNIEAFLDSDFDFLDEEEGATRMAESQRRVKRSGR